METNTTKCLFSYAHYWSEFIEKFGDDPAQVAALLDLRDHALEDHLNARPCGGSDCNYWVFTTSALTTINPGAVVDFDVVEIECGNVGDVTLVAGRPQFNVAGDFEITPGLGWESVIAGDIELDIRRYDSIFGGSAVIMADNRVAPTTLTAAQSAASRIVSVNAGDSIDMFAYQSSGGPINTTPGDSTFSRTYIQIVEKCTCGTPIPISGV